MPWDRWNEVQAWRDRLDRLASPHREAWAPAVDVYETSESYVVTAEVPGLTRDQIDVELDEGRLTIRGRRSHDPATTAIHYHQVERGHGSFARTFEFSEKVDRDRVGADLANGVLSVTLRKLPSPAARRITVK